MTSAVSTCAQAFPFLHYKANMNTSIPTILIKDFYKVGHVHQYPKGVTRVYSNFTPRHTLRKLGGVQDVKGVVWFGFNYFMNKYLVEHFDQNFFKWDKRSVLQRYEFVLQQSLNISNPDVSHIEKLHDFGRLPLNIWSLPEGSVVPYGTPCLVIANTEDWAYWLPNCLETLISMSLWKPSTSATTALRFKKLLTHYARAFGEKDLSFISYQAHDFSMRGMSGLEDAILSGMGHMTSFVGTDNIPAVLESCRHYGAYPSDGQSVPATEHSVMCAGGPEGEYETFRRLIEDIYPSGIVSIVSDTWDIWKVLTDYIPRLKESILRRNGRVIIRPDSGDPVKIICGNPHAEGPEKKGVARLLEEVLGSSHGVINNAGMIYGDGITEDRCEAILKGLIAQNLSPRNIVFGLGSYTYEYVTRDTDGWAMKATAIVQDDVLKPIFKDPVTGSNKKSHKGIPTVHHVRKGVYETVEESTPEMLDNCAFIRVFSNGEGYCDPSTEMRLLKEETGMGI